MKVLIKDIMGRLGNILFSYIAGYYTYINNNYDDFYLLKDYISDDYLNFVIEEGFIQKNIKFINRVPDNFFICNEYKTYEQIPNYDNIFIKGYRQSPNYWNNDENFIFNLIQPYRQKEIEIAILNEFSNIDFNNLVSLNIRRGDYLNESCQKVIGVQSIEYYKRAISNFNNEQKFLVVSDDIEWCKSQFKGNNFIFLNKNINNYNKILVDLFAIGLCKDNIISNSTFSWWGAYLNKHKDKKIYYPKPFFKVMENINNYIPADPRWMSVQGQFI